MALKSDAARDGANPFGALFDQDGSLVGAPANMAMVQPVGPAFSPFQAQPLFVMVDPIDAPPQDSPSQDVAQADAPPQAAEQASASPAPAPSPQQQVAEAEPGGPGSALTPVRADLSAARGRTFSRAAQP